MPGPTLPDQTTSGGRAAPFAQCAVIKLRSLERCSGEAVDDDPKALQICVRHLAQAMELVAEQKRKVARKGVKR